MLFELLDMSILFLVTDNDVSLGEAPIQGAYWATSIEDVENHLRNEMGDDEFDSWYESHAIDIVFPKDKKQAKASHFYTQEEGKIIVMLRGEKKLRKKLPEIQRIGEEVKVAKKIGEVRSRQHQKNAGLIYDFIVSTFGKYDLDRYNDRFRNDEERKQFGFDFGSMANFRAVQKKFVDEANEKMIVKLEALMLLIKTDEVNLMDKESMVPFPASGFCFDTEGKLIVFNER